MPHACWPKDSEGCHMQVFAYPGGNTSDKALREVRRTPCQAVETKIAQQLNKDAKVLTTT